MASILAPSDTRCEHSAPGKLGRGIRGDESKIVHLGCASKYQKLEARTKREVFRPPFVQVHHYLPVAAPCCDSCAITASRLNAAGFCRGGNLTKLAISPATTACIKYIWGT